jgi:hypothetical protein
MSSALVSRISPFVEAAKQLLLELEQHATASLDTLSRGNGTEFLAAVEKRDAILEELSRVTDALAHERAHFGGGSHEERREVQALIAKMSNAANGAMASQQRLIERATETRDRLDAAVKKAGQPDTVATQYAATTPGLRQSLLSVTG